MFEHIKRKLNELKNKNAEKRYRRKRESVKKQLKSRDFTIISNNCWAGKVYQYLDMPYLTPTVGLYFFSAEYIKFASNLKYYLSLDLKFISLEESRYHDELVLRKCTDKPIGVLDDVEIVFLHYKSEEEAYEKWTRRNKRVNYEHLVFKDSNMNLCKEEDIAAFDALPYTRKIFLNNRRQRRYNCEHYWSGYDDVQYIVNDTTIGFPGDIDLVGLLD